MKSYHMRLKLLVFTLEKMGKEISSLRFKPHKTQFLHRHVPYFSQWESKELVKDIIAGTLSAQDDPRWRKSGAKTKQEYELWSWNGCGMACFKMILASVHPNIRTYSTKPSQKGGHLVLMLGYDMKQQSFYLHNPSWTTPKTQAYSKIPFNTFGTFFAHRGITLTPPHNVV